MHRPRVRAQTLALQQLETMVGQIVTARICPACGDAGSIAEPHSDAKLSPAVSAEELIQMLCSASADAAMHVMERLLEPDSGNSPLVQVLPSSVESSDGSTACDLVRRQVEQTLIDCCLDASADVRSRAVQLIQRCVRTAADVDAIADPDCAFCVLPWRALDQAVFARSYDLPAWYRHELTAWCTFRTEAVPLAEDEARAMLEVHERGHGRCDLIDALLTQLKSADSDPLARCLARVRHAIDDALQRAFEPTAGAFVRLSTRSPKDAVLQLPQYHAALEAERVRRPDGDYAVQSRQCALRCGRITTADQALLLLASSERVAADLRAALQWPRAYEMHVLLREFVDMPPECEFRTFVHHGQPTAISQYFTHCRFPVLHALRAGLQASIVAFVQRLVPCLPFSSFVLDLYVDVRAGALCTDRTATTAAAEASSLLPVRVIEVNPFLRATDACLFSWVVDDALLRNGPCQLRIVE